MKDPVNQFLQSVKVICPKITQAELAYMEEGLTIKKLKPKHFFIQANTIQKEIGYLFEGLIRSFYIDDKGNEITVNFIREENYATHYSAFITQQPCKYNFQCLEPTIAVCLNYDYIQEGYKKYPNIERYGRLIAEEVLKMQQKRIEGFLFDTPERRYLDFIENNPGLFNRVSLSHLSSYLGIERQSLTRIRQKLANMKF